MHHIARLTALLLLIILPVTGFAAPVQYTTPNVTRAEAAMILLKTRLKAVNIPDVPAQGKFPDVKRGDWFERYVTLAARYGILEAQPGTGNIRPNDVVLRSEFLKMLATAFGLQLNLPYLYRDVVPASWYAPYAGIASRYVLFPADPDQSRLAGDKELTHEDAMQALRILSQQLADEHLPALKEVDLAKKQSAYQLTLYDRISTKTENSILMQAPSTLVLKKPAITPPPPPAYDNPKNIPSLREEILVLTNAERRRAGLPALKRNAALESSAQAYADDMARRGFFGHQDPEGRSLQSRIEVSGYYRSFYELSCLCVARYTVAENIARGQRTAKEVVDAWMASPSHKLAILTPAFSDIGIGLNAGIWVQHFGGKSVQNK